MPPTGAPTARSFPRSNASWVPLALLLGAPAAWAGSGARLVLALGAVGIALWQARTPATDPADLVRRTAWIAAALVLLSPAQYPWYAIWFLPFLPFLPLRCFLVLTVTLPVYYVFFHFNARGAPDVVPELGGVGYLDPRLDRPGDGWRTRLEKQHASSRLARAKSTRHEALQT